MVGGHRVAEQCEDPGAADILDHGRWAADVVEERRMLDVSRVVLPDIGRRLRNLDRLPLFVTGKHFGVLLVEHGGVDLIHGVGNFLAAWPDVPQVHRFAVLAIAQRLAAEVGAHRAGQRIGHHQRRGGQPVGFHQWMHPAFEVAIAREHGGHGEVGLLDGFLDGLRQRPGVADASGAAIADQGKAQFIEVLGQAGRLVVVGDHFRAGGQRALHPGFAFQAFFHGLLRHQPGGHHHAGVGGVGAGGDRGDDHGAVFQAIGLAFVIVIRFAGHIGIADGNTATAFTFQAAFFLAGGLELQVGEVAERLRNVGQRHPVLWAFWSGEAGFDAAHVQRQAVGEHRFLAGQAPQALGLAVGLDQLHRFQGPAGQAQVFQRDVVHREETAGGAVFRGHVGDGRAVGQRQVGKAVAVEFDEFAHHAFLAQHLGHGQHQVGGGDAFLELAGEFETDDFGNQHRHRLPEHRRFRLDTADAPAEYAEAVDHGGVGVGADQGVGEGVGAAVLVLGPDGAAQVFQVDLVADAGARRHHAEVVEGALAPAQERITLAIALHFNVDVLLEGAAAGELVDHHRVVDHQVHRRQRVDPLRIAAGLGHRRAHRGQVDHRRYAGEVLHQHPRRAVLDFAVGATLLEPRGQCLEVGAGDGFFVLPAQQVFQQDFQRHRQLVQITQAFGGIGQAEVVVGLVADLQGLERIQAIEGRHCDHSFESARLRTEGMGRTLNLALFSVAG
ncbi:hypothetical protein D3C80_875940 [compost metagenome]